MLKAIYKVSAGDEDQEFQIEETLSKDEGNVTSILNFQKLINDKLTELINQSPDQVEKEVDEIAEEDEEDEEEYLAQIEMAPTDDGSKKVKFSLLNKDSLKGNE
ncbi:hypothetical protein K502DRAFT_366944 [Neoconidiobolus thromboides FSU 785]|nr:hypothetical protein K502DRAFT_366944 [Neoconidiobolus thromboides FSU 785]